MTDAGDVVRSLATFSGSYRGSGVNHEEETFTGTLLMQSAGAGAGLLWTFEARDESTLFHAETSLVAAGPDGTPTLWNLGSNLGFVAPHRLVSWSTEGEIATAVFQFGEDHRTEFVERLRLACVPGAVTYSFEWGHPGDPLRLRSSVTMRIREAGA